MRRKPQQHQTIDSHLFCFSVRASSDEQSSCRVESNHAAHAQTISTHDSHTPAASEEQRQRERARACLGTRVFVVTLCRRGLS